MLHTTPYIVTTILLFSVISYVVYIAFIQGIAQRYSENEQKRCKIVGFSSIILAIWGLFTLLI